MIRGNKTNEHNEQKTPETIAPGKFVQFVVLNQRFNPLVSKLVEFNSLFFPFCKLDIP
ncbi:hypothetical protein Bmyc01_50750 [Bacillus mycoides]|nr:hypothetical protein Bmyc01_50750 [Bacillus mycoides]